MNVPPQDLQPIHNLGYSRSQWRAIQKQLDSNGTGRITNQQLIEIMRRYASRANQLAREKQREEEAQTLLAEVCSAAGKELQATGQGGGFVAKYRDWKGTRGGGGGAASPSWMMN